MLFPQRDIQSVKTVLNSLYAKTYNNSQYVKSVYLEADVHMCYICLEFIALRIEESKLLTPHRSDLVDDKCF